MVVSVAALLGLVALTLPQLLIPDSRVVREAVADAVALSLLLMAVPPIAMIAMHLAKARMNRSEAGAQEIGLAEYYQRIANPLGVLSVLLIGSMVVILSSWAVVPFLIFGVLLMVTTIVLTMNNERRAERRREAEWPMLLSIPIRWAHLRRELGRLRRKMAAAHKKRRLSREMRDRISTSLTDMGNAVTMLERDVRRGRIRWIIEDHHQLLWLYIAWIAVPLGALIAAVAPRFIWIATATTARVPPGVSQRRECRCPRPGSRSSGCDPTTSAASQTVAPPGSWASVSAVQRHDRRLNAVHTIIDSPR